MEEFSIQDPGLYGFCPGFELVCFIVASTNKNLLTLAILLALYSCVYTDAHSLHDELVI